MIAISLFIVGVALLMDVERTPTEYPITEIGMGSLFIVLSMPLLIAAARMWTVATRIPRNRR